MIYTKQSQNIIRLRLTINQKLLWKKLFESFNLIAFVRIRLIFMATYDTHDGWWLLYMKWKWLTRSPRIICAHTDTQMYCKHMNTGLLNCIHPRCEGTMQFSKNIRLFKSFGLSVHIQCHVIANMLCSATHLAHSKNFLSPLWYDLFISFKFRLWKVKVKSIPCVRSSCIWWCGYVYAVYRIAPLFRLQKVLCMHKSALNTNAYFT